MINKHNIAIATAVFYLLAMIFTTVGLPGVATARKVDSDGDLYPKDDGDCNDDDPMIYPGAVEIPDDGIDQNCDGAESSTIGMAPLVASIAGVLIALGAAVCYARRRMGPDRRRKVTARRRR